MVKIRNFILSIFLLLLSFAGYSQLSYRPSTFHPKFSTFSELKIKTRSHAMLIGIQKGQFTFLELGTEFRWTKVRVVKQRTFALGGTMEYNFKNNILGYKLFAWRKVGRINLTYGAALCYITDFDNTRVGGGPTLGFRLIGFHLITGYNFTVGDSNFKTYNTLYIALRYSIPLDKKIKLKKSKR